MSKDRNHFQVTVIGTGDRKTLEEVLYSMSDLILETLVKAQRAYEIVQNRNDMIEQGKQSNDLVV